MNAETQQPTPETQALFDRLPSLYEVEKAMKSLERDRDRTKERLDELKRERDEAREELADIRQRLKGHADSKLDGENGLAAATMRGFEQLQAENEAMREAIKEAEALLVAVDNGAQRPS